MAPLDRAIHWAAAHGVALDPKDYVALAAVAISLVALVATQITTVSKTRREKREELKESIEKLMDFRTEFNARQATFRTEPEREFFSSTINTRKSIYLEWAERLARELPYVTPAEWIVLGSEHMFDSNFAHAEEVFERAVKAERRSSAVTRVTTLRQLAWARMMMGPETWPRARRSYQQAARLMAGRTDAYSGYTNALTYRLWAEAEFAAGNPGEARDRLRDALAACRAMPDGFDYKGFEVRRCVADLMTLSDTTQKSGDIAGAREALVVAADALAAFSDDFSKEMRAQVLVRRVQMEIAAGDPVAAEGFAAQAHGALEALPVDNPFRRQGFAALSSLPPAPAPPPLA